jgi:transmembrane sensor
VSVATNPGKSLRATLPDGTHVWLNAESKLVYPEEFRDSLRQVTLTGEAYFDVAHNAEQPFVIESNGLLTRVLGTRFLIKSYKGDVLNKVSVFSGKVRVDNTNAEERPNVVLLPSQQLVANRFSGSMDVVEGMDSLAVMSWTTGKLAYRNAPLSEVLDDLGRRYQVKIHAEKHLQKCLIHLDVLPADQLKDVLDLLAISLNGKAEVRGNSEYQLRGKGCK